jgi:hypothetical protein
MKSPQPGAPSFWLAYVGVDDICVGGEERRRGGGGRGAENGSSVNGALIPPMLFSKRCRSPTW